MAATDEALPFWLTANRYGKLQMQGAFVNLSELSIGKTVEQNQKFSLGYMWAGNLVCGWGDSDFYYQLNQVYAGFFLNNWAVTAGAFYDPLRYAGLSTTNGNLARSGNTRPYPMVRLSTLTYKPVPFLNPWLFFKGEYDEGFLNDRRYVRHARMHHKSFYFLFQPWPSWKIEAGVEHYVMWGGTSKDRTIGKMPQDFKAYLQYVTGASGDENFPQMDQNNIAGNQLGTYQLEVKKSFPGGVELTFYLSHPFEDLSGVNWRNWPDNLLGGHLHFKNKNEYKKQWLTDIVYEFTNTRQQSVRDSLYEWNNGRGVWERQAHDNYFTHSIYRSGFTYHGQIMASPLFFPIALDKEGIPEGSYAIHSTRFYAHHIGCKGICFSEHIQWKTLLTYTRHFGTYVYPFQPVREQLSGLIDFRYSHPRGSLELGLSVAIDTGNTIRSNWGLEFRVAKRFL